MSASTPRSTSTTRCGLYCLSTPPMPLWIFHETMRILTFSGLSRRFRFSPRLPLGYLAKFVLRIALSPAVLADAVLLAPWSIR